MDPTGVTRVGLAALAIGFGSLASASADEASARTILKNMADYLGRQSSLSLTYDSEIEIVTPAIEKIQFSASGSAVLSRPDKARLERTGGYADVELVFDGKTLTVHDRGGRKYAQAHLTASFDQLVDRLRSEHLLEIPGADLLLGNAYDELMDGVLEAKHIGRGVVGGVECEHLAFRKHDVDWQIWIELGEHPLPRKYVVTSKTVAAAPQYTLRIRDWKTDVKPGPDTFEFAPAAGVARVESDALIDLDEIPHGMVDGGRK